MFEKFKNQALESIFLKLDETKVHRQQYERFITIAMNRPLLL